MAKIVKLKNKKTGEYSYPVTVTKAVADAESGERLNDVLAQKVEEAPMDGKQYARMNGAWGEVEAGAISEIALISLLPNNDDLIGATVKVTTSDGEEILNTTWQGAQLSANVPNGAEYTVSVGNVDGYVTPEAQTYTAIKGVTRTVTMTYTESRVQVNILSNQENDTTIAAVKATVKYGSTSVEAGNGEYVNLPLNVDVTITFPEVEGYKTPDAISYSHTSGGYAKSGTYQTEIVTVTLSADDDSSVSGQVVTINGTAHTWSGTAITQKVAYGTTYTVSVDDRDGYTTPSSIERTASQSAANLELIYTENSLGVFIQGVSGKLYTADDWSSQETPNGIAVLTENCRFVMALKDAYSSSCDWGGYGTAVNGILTTTSSTTAATDYKGEANTPIIINALYGTNDGSADGAPAAEYCAAYQFPNGKYGYLGAAGEWQAALNNKDAIDAALSACCDTSMTDYYWTSTQYSSDGSWYMDWSNEYLNYDSKVNHNSVRAFAAI